MGSLFYFYEFFYAAHAPHCCLSYVFYDSFFWISFKARTIIRIFGDGMFLTRITINKKAIIMLRSTENRFLLYCPTIMQTYNRMYIPVVISWLYCDYNIYI